jgi:hypothetical protein
VNLINEDDDFRVFLHFPDDSGQPFLEFTAILRSRDQRCGAQLHNPLSAQNLRVLPLRNPDRQRLYDRSLTDPGLAYQYRVVLRLPGQRLDYLKQFLPAADERPQPAFPGQPGQVSAIAVQVACVVAFGSLLALRLIGILRFRNGLDRDALEQTLSINLQFRKH